MTNSWDEMRKAKEDSYFEKRNREALERISSAKKIAKPLLSPVTGEPMEQVVIDGVVVNRCKSSGGIWLEPAELEQLVETHKHHSDGVVASWVSNFMKSIKA